MEDALPRLMLDESGAPLKIDTKFEERMGTLHNEGKLLLAARVACTVALKEVSEATIQKSKVALARETSRLIGRLEINGVPLRAGALDRLHGSRDGLVNAGQAANQLGGRGQFVTASL